MQKLQAIAVVLFAILGLGQAHAQACKPIKYADGDTFTARMASGGDLVRVRVAGFDAPERGQPFASRATQYMRELTAKGADCDCYKLDRYGRSICTVRTAAGDNVAALMLAAGFGCIDARFEREASSADRQNARAALEQAQQERRGMWSVARPVCGYDHRREKRAAGT
jgi:endonuclease YncB( thermonuclease family)